MHPLGTNDVSLRYRTEGTPPPELARLVRARLEAAQLVARVEAQPDGINVTVDRDESGTVDALLTWRGGIALYDAHPEVDLPVSDPSGLERRSAKWSWGEEHYYEGPTDTVAQAVRGTKPAHGERLVTLREDRERARTLVVAETPRVDLTDAVASARADGRTLVLRLDPEGTARLEAAKAGAGRVAVVRDHTALAAIDFPAADPLVVPLGGDLAAFATARALASLIATAPLPHLIRTSAVAVPTEWSLATMALIVPFLLSLAWLAFIRRFDRAHPEPWWLVGATFGLGCLSVIPAAIAEIGWSRASQWLDPSLVTMGGEALSLPLALPVFAVVIGLSEEGSKFLGAWGLAFHRREFDEPIDGIVYGAASSLGFAAVENVKYFAVGRLTPSLVAVRMFMSVPAHLFFGAIWGYALGRKLIFPKTRVLGYLALAAVLHGAFDAFLSVSSFAIFSLGLNLTLATLFILLLRHSLRHGVVTPAVAGADSLRRALYPVGSTSGFVASIVALYTFAAALFVSSAYAGGAEGGIGPAFLITMSLLVVALGASAYGFSATMPLDVVLDDYGVTFAGSARAWRSIQAIQPARRGLRLRTSEGDLWLGPARPAEVNALAQAIGRRAGR